MVLTERPVGEGGADRARPDGQAHRAAVGQGRLRLHGPGEVSTCSASGCSLRCSTRSTWSRTGSARPGELHTIPKEEQGVYDQLCRTDSVGVFQVNPELRWRHSPAYGHGASTTWRARSR
jgi:error-prone DNA polymerase